MILRHEFAPIDNRRLAHLCGPTDAHLRTIESALDVRITHREAAFRIEGAKARAEGALAVLLELYQRAGHSLDPQAVALAVGSPNRATPAGDDETASPVLQTRRTDLAGRTPNQVQYLATSCRTISVSASGQPARGRPFSPWPARSTRWSAARCSASC